MKGSAQSRASYKCKIGTNLKGLHNYPGKRDIVKNPPKQGGNFGRDKFKVTNPRNRQKVI